MKHPYLNGFLKGLCYVVIVLLIYGILLVRFDEIYRLVSLQYALTLAFITIEYWMIRKAKLPQAYYFMAIMLNILFLPFLMGSISVIQNSKGDK